MSDKWYKVGKEGTEESARKDAQAKAKAEQRENRRFWLTKDSSAKIVFLDNPQFFLSEHNIEMNGSYGNFFTCLNDFDECPLCLHGDSPRYAVVSTIIDTSSYTSNEGIVYANQKKLFVAIGECRKNLLKQITKRNNNIQYFIYEVSRGSTQNEPNTGRDFELVKQTSKTSIEKWVQTLWKKEGKEFKSSDIEKFLTPFDYVKVFAPKTPAELRKLVGMTPPMGSTEIPFIFRSDYNTTHCTPHSSTDVEESSQEGEPESLDALL